MVSHAEVNLAVLAWGTQRAITDFEPRGGGEHTPAEKRQLSDFYGVDEPSLNSFVHARGTRASRSVRGSRSSVGAAAAAALAAASRQATAHAAPPAAEVARRARAGGGLGGLARPAKRAVSLYDRAYARPRARPRTQRQPATMPARNWLRRAARDALSPTSAAPSEDAAPRGRSHLSHQSRRGVRAATAPAVSAHTAPANARVAALEDELRAERAKTERLRRRNEELERRLADRTDAVPVVDSILRTAMGHFEAKEAALQNTIADLKNAYAAAVAANSRPPLPTAPVCENGAGGGSFGSGIRWES